MSLWAAVVLAAAFSWMGWAAGWLTVGGAGAAAAVGSVVFVAAGLAGATLLALLFLSGSLLTYGTPRRARRGRAGRQVLANGSWAALGALLAAGGSVLGWALLAGALASAQADTWATEIGAGSTHPPHLITTGRPVAAGTSGGVTLRGTAGGVAGAMVMGAAAVAVGLGWQVGLAAAAGGTVGMLVDSLLGAAIQGHYRCERCGAVGETATHVCGGRGHLLRGTSWIDNDAVNLLASGIGGAVAVGLRALV